MPPAEAGQALPGGDPILKTCMTGMIPLKRDFVSANWRILSLQDLNNLYYSAISIFFFSLKKKIKHIRTATAIYAGTSQMLLHW